MTCTHWHDGYCKLGRYGGRPSFGVCGVCPENTTGGIWPTVNQAPISVTRVCNRPFAPIPRKQWPEWAKQIADRQADGDMGVGDTTEREIGSFASAAFKAWYKAMFKKTCGCEHRKQEWNEKYLYRQLT